MRDIGGEMFDRIDPLPQRGGHVRDRAGEHADLVAALRQARHFDLPVTALPHAHRGMDQFAQRTHDGLRKEERQQRRDHQRQQHDQRHGRTGFADAFGNVDRIARQQQRIAVEPHRRSGVDHMRAVGRIAQDDLRQAVLTRARQFGPVADIVGLGLDIVGQGGGAHHPVEPAIEPQCEGALVDFLRAWQDETGRGELEAIRFERAVGAVDPQAQALLLADLDQQRFLPLRRRASQRFGSDLRLHQRQLETLVEQLLAIGIDIDDPAAQQHQRQNVDEQDAAGEREPPRPALLLDSRIAFEDTAGFGHCASPQPSLKL